MTAHHLIYRLCRTPGRSVKGQDPRHLALRVTAVGRSTLARNPQIPHCAGDLNGSRTMAREGYFILDSDLHLMEPYDLWERYLDAPHKANPPHFFAAHRRAEEEVKVVGMEVQGLAIPAHGRQAGAIASGRDLRRRSRARHPHFQLAQAQGFDAASTLTAMDIEGIDVAVMYGTRGRQVLSHDNLPPDYAAALARAYNNWTHDYCAHDPMRLKFAGQVAMHDIPSAIAEARRCVTELGDHRHSEP